MQNIKLNITQPIVRRSRRPRPFRYLCCAVALLLGAFGPISPPAHAATCSDIYFVFARGSGELLGGDNATGWQTSLENILAFHPGLSYQFYELGSQAQAGYQYPAVAVGVNGFGSFLTTLGAFASAGEAFAFGDSVRQGRGELQAYISSVGTACPDAKFVLGGYSQGAMVISGALADLDPERILYVATFGDPKLYLPEGQRQLAKPVPDACFGRNLSPYRRYAPNCLDFEGILGSYRPYQTTGYAGKLGIWCHDDDVMCSAGFSLDDHTSYVAEDLYADAAATIATSIAAAYDRPDLEVAILVDTTASMQRYDSELALVATSLAHQVTSAGGRVALVGFHDLDRPNSINIDPVCEFGCSTDDFMEFFDDFPYYERSNDLRHVLSAVLYTLDTLAWSPDATKAIVLITDAYPDSGCHISPHLEIFTTEDVAAYSNSLGVRLDAIVDAVVSGNAVYTTITTNTGGTLLTLFDAARAITNSFTTFSLLGTDDADDGLGLPEPAAITDLSITRTADAATITFATNAAFVLLIVDDVILGRVPLIDQQGSITLTDLSADAKLSLIPYSVSLTRGVTATAAIPANEQSPIEQPPAEQPPAPAVTAPAHKNPASPAVPLAPNTGYHPTSNSDANAPRTHTYKR